MSAPVGPAGSAVSVTIKPEPGSAAAKAAAANSAATAAAGGNGAAANAGPLSNVAIISTAAPGAPVDPTSLLQPAGGPPSAAAAGSSSTTVTATVVGGTAPAGASAGAAAGTAQIITARPPAWQSKEDRSDRMQMIQQIVFLLRKRKPDAPPEWIQKLPEMARRLEDRLYRVAQSKMEYQNMATLKQRLQDVAIKMGAKAKHSQQSHSSSSAPRSALLKAIREAAQAGQIRQHPKEGPVVVVRINDETQMVPISRLKREQQDEVYEMYKAHRDQQSRRAGGGGASGHHRGGVNPRDVNPQMAGLNPSSYGSSSGSDAKRAKMSGGHSRPPSGSTAPPRNTDEHRKAIMRQQQQRLLLLRHASKCQEKRGKCKATALCAQMKELWQHIAQCKDQHCLHPHCVSSRYVLSHYHRCKQRNCEVCAPVRLAIQKQNNQKRPSSKKSKSKKAAKAPPQVTVKPPEPQKQKPRMPTQQSLIDTWSHATIQAHLENLNRLFNPYYTKQVMKDSMLPLLKKLTEEEYGWIFNKPVDPLELGLPDYFDIISKPMDLGTVRKNLEKGKYKLPAAVSDDVNLCFDNAMKYNPDDSEVYQLALRFKKIFMKSFRIEASSLREKEHKQRENENSCKLCGGEMFQFEPPVYYCNGTCGTRIRRNSYYHVTPDNKGHYCMQCYGKLDETIQVGENVIPKANLQKKKNDDNTEESWVQCETCDGWMHQICAVFNSRQNDNDDAEIKYTCAVCLAKQREHLGENVPPPKKGTLPYLSAKELPKTELSNFLEKRVRTLEKEYGEAHPELKVPETTLRVVSHKTNPCYTKVEMHKEYCDAEGYPTQFDYISKCILMFQNLDGVEVLLFGFYIQEYDDECPEPNRRRCYLAYLDSVKYFEPPALRSPMYQTILNGYFAHAKMRGFVAGYIWACPPLKGDDYILYCHPESQMIPKAERLRLWYHKMIDRAIAEGIVIERTNIYDEHMVPKPRARYAIAGQFAGVHEPPSEEYFKQRKKRRDQELEEELQREEAIARKAQAHDRKLRKEAEAKKVAEKLKAEKEKRAAAVAAAKAAAAGVTVKPEPGAASAAASEGAKAPAAAAAAAEKAAAPGAMEVDVPAADAAAKDASKADAAGSSASSSTKAAAGGSADKAPKSAASGAGAMEVEEGAKVADKAAGADEEKKADSDADVSSGAVAVKAKKKLAPWLVTPTPLPIGAGDSEMLDVTSLPYFDGDYWPGVMEDLLREKVSTKKKELPTPAEAKAEKAAAKAAEEKEKNSSAARRRARSERRTGDAEKDGDDDEEDDKDGKGKGGKGKSIANKPARVTRRTSSRNAPTPENLGPTAAELEGLEKGIAINLQKLQPKLETMKADFIVIKLHYQCSCCHQYILFGNIWRKPEVNDTSAAVAAAAASAPTPSIEDATPSASGAATPMTSTSTATSVAGTPANERAEGVPSAAAQTAAAAKDVAAAAAKLTAKASGVGSLSARGMNTRGGNSHRSKPPKSKSTSHRKAKGAKVEQKIGGTSHENKSSAQSRVDNHWMGSQHRSPASVLNTPFKLCDSCVQAQMMLPIMERLADFSDDMVPTPMKVDADMMEECTDRDRQISSEFFDKRQQFLTLCQGNHYQFDQLRRAKHSSMMVIWHMHHPKMPAYVHSCNICRKDIVSGHRWECGTCADFDLCDDCKNKPAGRHPHELKKVPVTAAGQNELQASKNRERAIRLHMQLLVHASGCRNPRCPSANCSKMKHLLKHGATCITRATGGCHICRRIWALLQIHARQCRERNCPVPRCRDLKEHLRRMQNAMDSRRRSAYRRGVNNDQATDARRAAIRNMARGSSKGVRGGSQSKAKSSSGRGRVKSDSKAKGRASRPTKRGRGDAKGRAPKRSRAQQQAAPAPAQPRPQPTRSGRTPKRSRN